MCRPDRTRRSRVSSTQENRRFSKWTDSPGCPAAGPVLDDFFHGQLAIPTDTAATTSNQVARDRTQGNVKGLSSMAEWPRSMANGPRQRSPATMATCPRLGQEESYRSRCEVPSGIVFAP